MRTLLMASVAGIAFSAMPLAPALAACITTGNTTNCDASSDQTTMVGTGVENDRTLTVTPNGRIQVGNSSAISLRDNAVIRIQGGGSVSNASTNSTGSYNTGGNTVEFRSNGLLTVEEGAAIRSLGTQTSAEAVNLQGVGNLIVNNGLIEATNAAAIWFQTTSGLNTIVNNETGIIRAPGNVIGSSGNAAVDFTNRGRVEGNLVLAGGDDTLRLFTGSTITGSFSGGAGFDRIFLNGDGTSTMPGAMTGFEELTKDDAGTWTLSGSISGVTVATVRQGILALTGDNSRYTGQVIVEAAGTLEARAQSLPPTVTNDGLVRFVQTDDGTYTGRIIGAGWVDKVDTGVLTLAPSAPGGNTYSGGTRITAGTLAIGSDSAIGASTGAITFNGGALRFDAGFDLAPTRPISIAAPGGTIDTNGFATSIAQGITGAGGLTVTGAGVLSLTGENSYAGGTTIAGGTLQIGNGGTTGSIQGNVLNNGALVFNRLDTFAFANSISGTGQVRQEGAGATILGGTNTYTGETQLNAGVLRAGAAGVFSAGSTHVVAPGGELDLAGHAQTVGGMVNAGLVSLRGAPGNTLTVAGGYVGQGGVVALNARLGGDGSPSDRLVIVGGVASGDTGLRVTNIGGQGALTTAGGGIRVVEATLGGTTETGAFRLANRVAAGSLEYQLYRGGKTGGDDWFLRTTLPAPDETTPSGGTPPNGLTSGGGGGGSGGAMRPVIPLYRPEVALYAPIPAVGRQMALATLGTLHERVGEQENMRDLGTQGGLGRGGWARVIGERSNSRLSGTVNSRVDDANFIGIQAGFDLFRQQWASGHRDHAGVYFAYTDFRSSAVSGFAMGRQNLRVGRLTLNGPTAGAYWTHFGPSGWYLDAVIQGNWFDAKASSYYGSQMSTNGSGLTGSLEGGYPIRLSQRWQIEPQAQIIWQSVSVSKSQDAFSTIGWNEGDAVTGRVGARLQYTARDARTLWQPFAKVNLWHGFAGTDRAAFGNSPAIETRFGSTSVEVGGGVTARITQVASLYAHVDHRWSVDGRERHASTQGALGLRLNW